ncbi:MAG: hypothetical protein LBB85_00045 [Dysgonamonadaceae bacterium]|jgi:hypothetical protein|nr:hypothetical protein [Dysgonamonadaceae bacterium]
MKTGNNQLAGLTLCSLLAVFTSCDRLEDGGAGNKTQAQFSLGRMEAWGAETLLRASSERPRTIETVSVPLENNWILEASLMEEPAAPTRATANLPAGTKIHIIARNSSNTAVIAESDYVTQSDGSLVPDAQSMKLEDGVSYYFTAYAYSAPTDLFIISADDPVSITPYNNGIVTNDFLLGVGETVIQKTASGEIALPTLNHQFSRVKYSLSAIEGNPELSYFTVSLTNNYAATLTKTGASVATVLTRGETTTAQLLSTGSSDDAYRIVYTDKESPALKISGTIGGSTNFSNVPVTYQNAFESGKSYILQINIKKGVVWANSNIYWDNTAKRLTFKPHGYTGANAEDAMFYQGVAFHWGSLVGISPGLVSEDEFNFVPSATPIYVYRRGTDPQWVQTDLETAVAGGLTAYPGFTDNTSIDGIPYVTVEIIGGSRSAGYLSNNHSSLVSENKGDICMYIGATGGPTGYRMPTSKEFGGNIEEFDFTTFYWEEVSPLSSTIGWHKGDNANFTNLGSISSPYSFFKDDGTTVLGPGVSGFATYSGTSLPASGFLGAYTGTISDPGESGYYWSSSVVDYSIHTAYNLHFNSSHVIPSFFTMRGSSFFVRCVKDY